MVEKLFLAALLVLGSLLENVPDSAIFSAFLESSPKNAIILAECVLHLFREVFEVSVNFSFFVLNSQNNLTVPLPTLPSDPQASA